MACATWNNNPMTPGTYLYTDPGTPPQRVEVVLDDGELCARFEDEVEGVALVPVADMAGQWSPA